MSGMLWNRIGGCAAALLLLSAAAAPRRGAGGGLPLKKDDAWYRGPEAARIADNVLCYQRRSGGWPKNVDMTATLSDAQRAELRRGGGMNDATIDNGATYSQIEFLARVHRGLGDERFRGGFIHGIDYLLAAQYPNGGWPQYYPGASGYHRHVTFNDDAMVGVLRLLRDVAGGAAPYDAVDKSRRERVLLAVERGVKCILRCQVHRGDQLTAWCAQHDADTLLPADARAYEKASLSGYETVGIVRFLMSIEQPTPEVVKSVESAVAWLKRVKLRGIRAERRAAAGAPRGFDVVVVHDLHAPPVWARFYAPADDRPIFCGRDGIVRYRLQDIEPERRAGYAWYTPAPATLLEREYPAWRAKWVERPGEGGKQ
jgi:PelA/Pel-15E family pectate lyase